MENLARNEHGQHGFGKFKVIFETKNKTHRGALRKKVWINRKTADD
jgi:hypothetical protein